MLVRLYDCMLDKECIFDLVLEYLKQRLHVMSVCTLMDIQLRTVRVESLGKWRTIRRRSDNL